MVCEKRNISVRASFRFLIKNLPFMSDDIPSQLWSHILFLTGASDNESGRPKDAKNRSLFEKIKDPLDKCDIPA